MTDGDICPQIGREWKKHFDSLEKPPSNVEYAAIDARELPFLSNSLDVISGAPAIAEIETDKTKALKEIHRVLKPGGLFVMKHIYVQNEGFMALNHEKQNAFLERWPEMFSDYLKEINELKFSSVELNKDYTRIVDVDSDVGRLAHELGIELVMQGYSIYCIK